MGMRAGTSINVDRLKLFGAFYFYCMLPIFLFRYIVLSNVLRGERKEVTRVLLFKSSSYTIGTVLFLLQAIAERNIFQLYFIVLEKIINLLELTIVFIVPRVPVWIILIKLVESLIFLLFVTKVIRLGRGECSWYYYKK